MVERYDVDAVYDGEECLDYLKLYQYDLIIMDVMMPKINGIETRFGSQLITAFVPLANLFGYVKTLRSLSQGRANPYMELSHYDEVPQNVADEVIKKMTK